MLWLPGDGTEIEDKIRVTDDFVFDLIASIPLSASGARSAQLSVFQRLEHGTGTVTNTEFGKDTRDLVLDGAFCRAKRLGDLAVAVPSCHEPYNLGLAHGQLFAPRLCLNVRRAAGT